MNGTRVAVSIGKVGVRAGALLFLSVSLCRVSAADGIEVGADEFAEVRVPAEAGLSSESLVVGDGAKVFKTGAGSWTVSTRGVSQANPAEVGVLKGMAVLSAEGAAAEPEIPSFVSERAHAWIDMSAYSTQPELFSVTSSEGVDSVGTCYDRREKDASDPKYPRLVVPDGGSSPIMKDLDGKSALWFGGYRSGCYANWFDASGTSGISCKEAYFVHRVENSIGFIGDMSLPVANHWLDAGGAYGGSTWQATVNLVRQYQDGVAFDGACTPMPCGTHVLNVAGSFWFGGMFRDSMGIGGKGGDYFCEVILFDTMLSERERLQLTSYLSAKWGVGGSVVSYAVREDAQLTVNATADGDRVLVSGRGTVVKTGEGRPVIDTDGDFGGVFETDAIGVDMRGALAVAPAAGVVLSSGADGDIGLSKTTGAAPDTWQKTGAGAAYVHEVPDSVKRVDVVQGTLTVWPIVKDALTGEADVEVAIPNAGFEEWDQEQLSENVYEVVLGPSLDFHGWYGDGSSSPAIFDFSRWPENEGSVVSRVTRKDWGIVAPPQGSCAVFLRHACEKPYYYAESAAVWTYVDIPVAGEYSFSCQVGGRNGMLGTPVNVFLIPDGAQAGERYRLGKLRYLRNNEYTKIVLTGMVSSAGRHKLYLEALSHVDRGVCLDDLHLWRRPDLMPEATVEKIPGGDFEDVNFDTANSYVKEFHDSNTNPGWTIVQPVETTATSIGYSAPGAALADTYAGGRPNEGGFSQLCFYHETQYTRLASGGRVETSFVPPAGKWRVRAAIARRNGASTLSATATVGGTLVDLGSNARSNQSFENWRWPVVFETDGTQEVALSFAFTTAAASARLYMDDVVLEPADAVQTDVELISNGDFEFLSWDGSAPADFAGIPGKVGNFLCRNYGFVPSAFGTDRVSGNKYLCVGNDNGLTQQVNLPLPGTYCLSYYAHRRIDNNCKNILRAWIVGPDGVSREVGRTRYENASFTRTAYYFTVSSAGTYTIGLAGVLTTGEWAPAYEMLIDGLSLRAVRTEESTSPFHPDLTISVAPGARLNLDYVGTRRIARLKLGGHSVSGIVDSSTHPDFIAGQGALEVPRQGMSLIIR